MTTINKLSTIDTLTGPDLVPVYSSENGDARKASMTTFKNFVAEELVTQMDSIQDQIDALENEIDSGAADLIGYTASGTGAVPTTVGNKLQESVSVKDFGATGDGVTDDTNAIQLAINAVAAAGGGRLYFPSGTYIVHLSEANYDPASDTLRVAALRWSADALHLYGDGIGATTIKAQSNEGRYAIFQILETPLENGITKIFGGSLSSMTLNGNYTGVTPVRDISVVGCAGLEDFTFKHLKIINSAQYGIGLQNGGYKDVRILDVETDTTCADGVDVKDNGSISKGCIVDGLIVRNFGRKTNVSDPYAGLDLLGLGWRVSNVYVTDYGSVGSPQAGIRFKQGGVAVARGYSPEYSTLSNFVIEQTNSTVSTMGVYIKGPYIVVTNGTIRGATSNGIRVEQPYCTIMNVLTYGTGTGGTEYGFLSDNRTSTDSAFLGGDDVNFIGCVAINHGKAFGSGRARVDFSNCKAISCGTAYTFAGASCTANRMIMSTQVSCTTPLSTNNNTAHVFYGNVGIAAPSVETPTTGAAAGQARHLAPSNHSFVTGYTGTAASGAEQFRVEDLASAVNRVQVQGGTVGSPPKVKADGSDTNIDLALTPKGTGLVAFGTHTSNADAPISGYITVKDAGGTSRKLAVIS